MQSSVLGMAGTRLAAMKLSAAALIAAGLLCVSGARAQDVKVSNTGIDEPTPVRYNNEFEAYGGINLMEFTAGNLPQRANLGGAELLGTWWATHHIGIGLDARGEAGTTKAIPTITYFPLVQQYMLMTGAQYRGPRSQRFALNYHGYLGASYGNFKSSLHGGNPQTYGLFPNATKPIGVAGVSVDWNRGANWAIRLTPDAYFTHFGNEWEQSFGLGLGVIYRFHDR